MIFPPFSTIMVTPQIIVYVMMDSRKRVSALSKGHLIAINRLPWPIVKRKCIPDVSKAEIVGVIHKEKVIRRAYSHINPETGWHDKHRWFFNHNRLRQICRRSHSVLMGNRQLDGQEQRNIKLQL
jgi:hypothetical protein